MTEPVPDLDDPAKTRVAIGIPCYNRPAGLRQTIDCLLAQTHQNWTALIADNATPDPAVEAVARQACAADPRFTYLRRPENIGAEANFRDVAERADGAYFMWASDDDLWEPDFIATCLDLLDKNPAAAMAFCTIDNINKAGLTIRTYPGFSRFTSMPTLEGARNYLRDPEIMGKANLVYGLFRTAPLKASIATFWREAGFGQWGGDMVFVFGFLSRYAAVMTDSVLLHKRVETDATEIKLRRHRKQYFVPRAEYESYVQRHMAVAPNPELADLARTALRKRLWESLAFRYLSKLHLAHLFD